MLQYGGFGEARGLTEWLFVAENIVKLCLRRLRRLLCQLTEGSGLGAGPIEEDKQLSGSPASCLCANKVAGRINRAPRRRCNRGPTRPTPATRPAWGGPNYPES